MYVPSTAYPRWRAWEREAFEKGHVEVIGVSPSPAGGVNLRRAIGDLGARGVISLLVEGGSHLTTALLNDDLVDELAVLTSPYRAGGGVRAGEITPGAPCPPGVAWRETMERWRAVEARQVGGDVLVRWHRDHGCAKDDIRGTDLCSPGL